jgi:hypothetical protein
LKNHGLSLVDQFRALHFPFEPDDLHEKGTQLPDVHRLGAQKLLIERVVEHNFEIADQMRFAVDERL